MKKIVEIVDGEGLDALLGEQVLIFAMNYIYAGKLAGINDTCIRLDEAQIVYETGKYTDEGYKDAQDLPGGVWYVATAAIESFGRGTTSVNVRCSNHQLHSQNRREYDRDRNERSGY